MPLIATTSSGFTTPVSITITTATSDPWPIWTSDPQSVTWPSPSVDTRDPWATWNTSITSTTSILDPWPQWNASTCRQNAIELGMRRAAAEAENPEIAEARRRQAAADREVWETRRRQNAAKREAADERAEKLLVSILSTSQREQYTKERRFTVHLPNGNRYMVRKGRHGNIERINEHGERIENLCVHVAPREIPDCDNMAAQKLMLEADEPELRRIANISRY